MDLTVHISIWYFVWWHGHSTLSVTLKHTIIFTKKNPVIRPHNLHHYLANCLMAWTWYTSRDKMLEHTIIFINWSLVIGTTYLHYNLVFSSNFWWWHYTSVNWLSSQLAVTRHLLRPPSSHRTSSCWCCSPTFTTGPILKGSRTNKPNSTFDTFYPPICSFPESPIYPFTITAQRPTEMGVVQIVRGHCAATAIRRTLCRNCTPMY